MGDFRAAHARTVLIWEYLRPPPRVPKAPWCAQARACVRVCVCWNIFSETTRSIEAKFHEEPWDRGRKFIQMVHVICCSSF